MISNISPLFQESAETKAETDTRPSILIVDDRKENLLATEKILRSLHCTIIKANSGNEALTLLLHHRFAVILLDVQMPEMDGFETAMLMQQHDNLQGAPIIFISAISKEEKYASRAAEIGAVDYIFKPVNPELLKNKVKVYLDLYAQREHILKLNRILTQSNEELERFAYICSHDMQEPVRMMNSYAQLLQEKMRELPEEKRDKYLKFISSNASHMQKMIQDILAFSRVGREEITLETVNCNEVLRDVLEEFEPVIADKKASIHFDFLPTIHASPTLMHALYQNLIGNALKFQDGSRMPEIAIRFVNEKYFWRFSVIDNGIGIDPIFRDKVFTIFQRLHRHEDYPGTGIGLSTCKKFIELCGGTIGFQAVREGGTEFFFQLPKENKIFPI